MGRTKGATNQEKQSSIFSLSEEKRIELLANLILDMITQEQPKQ